MTCVCLNLVSFPFYISFQPDQRESYTGRSGGGGASLSPLASSDSLTPYRTDRAGSSRMPLRRLQNSCPRLPVPTASGSKAQSRSLIQRFSGDQHDCNPSKKKRANIAEMRISEVIMNRAVKRIVSLLMLFLYHLSSD